MNLSPHVAKRLLFLPLYRIGDLKFYYSKKVRHCPIVRVIIRSSDRVFAGVSKIFPSVKNSISHEGV